MRKKLALHWQVVIALILGLIYARTAIEFGWIEFTADYIDPFGKIFINVLKLIAVPLVLFSIISGIVSLKDIRKLGRLGLKTVSIYLATTFGAVTIGLILVNLLGPGRVVEDQVRVEKRIEYEIWRNENNVQHLDTINFMQRAEYTDLVKTVGLRMQKDSLDEEVLDKIKKARQAKDGGPLKPIVDAVPNNIIKAMAEEEMLQVIFFAIFFGLVIVMLPPGRTKPVVDFVDSANEIFVRMVEIIMKAMPFFVFALMAASLVDAAGDNIDKLYSLLNFLLAYSGVVITGLVIIAFVVYPSLIAVFVKRISVRNFLKGINKAQLTAFSTSSSVATLPVTMDCVNNNLKVPKATTSFVLPIGATVNMDGTSLYQAVAVVALAQFHMVDLTIVQQVVIILTATLASIGAAAVPSAGLVLMILVLESVGLNPAWIAVILPVDRILDMCRTVVNVTGDATVSLLVSANNDEE